MNILGIAATAFAIAAAASAHQQRPIVVYRNAPQHHQQVVRRRDVAPVRQVQARPSQIEPRVEPSVSQEPLPKELGTSEASGPAVTQLPK
jgi:hypothetical protein